MHPMANPRGPPRDRDRHGSEDHVSTNDNSGGVWVLPRTSSSKWKFTIGWVNNVMLMPLLFLSVSCSSVMIAPSRHLQGDCIIPKCSCLFKVIKMVVSSQHYHAFEIVVSLKRSSRSKTVISPSKTTASSWWLCVQIGFRCLPNAKNPIPNIGPKLHLRPPIGLDRFLACLNHFPSNQPKATSSTMTDWWFALNKKKKKKIRLDYQQNMTKKEVNLTWNKDPAWQATNPRTWLKIACKVLLNITSAFSFIIHHFIHKSVISPR